MKNILVTDFEDSSEDVMIFTESLTVETVKQKLKDKGKTFGEVYEVETKDLQFYIYDPCWIK